MRVAIIGAGPTGLFLGASLARRGHAVTAVERDAGPGPDGWPRRGVMQFHHAHGFRPQCVEVLQTHLPDAYAEWLAAGAEPVTIDQPDGSRVDAGMRSRRQTFETALRTAAVHEPGLTLRRGHVDAVSAVDGRANGLVVGNEHIAADLVVDASGRSGRVTSRLRGPAAVGGTCGIAYVDRQYQLLAGAEPGPMSNPLAWQGDFDGYQVILFRHEQGIFSVLVIRPTRYKDLVGLRHNAGFDAACQAIPVLAEWTDRARCQPLTDVLPGGELKNYYRSQRGPDGRLALPGLVFVGDAVCTTTPTFGRGVATSLMQAAELLRLVDEHGTDVVAVATELDDWCETNMRPWVEDHIRMDGDQRRRWEGGDVDLDHRLPSNLIMVAAERDPTIAAGIGPYASMRAGPASLDAVEAKARAVYATGWRPPFADGPTKAELSQAVARTLR